MTALKSMDVPTLSRELPRWLDYERTFCRVLHQLGVDVSQLEVLRGDQHLLAILAEEAEDPGAESSRRELERLISWHDARLTRLAVAVGATP